MNNLKPYHIDGALWCVIAALAAMWGELQTDDAKQFISPATLFWLKVLAAGVEGGVVALKAYRATNMFPQLEQPMSAARETDIIMAPYRAEAAAIRPTAPSNPPLTPLPSDMNH